MKKTFIIINHLSTQYLNHIGIRLKYMLNIKFIKRKNNYHSFVYLFFINFVINIFNIFKYYVQLI